MTTPSMPSARDKIIEHRIFFATVFLLLLIAAMFSIAIKRTDLFLALTPWHSEVANYFFICITRMGNGFFAIALGLFLAFRKQYTAAMVLLLSFSLSGICTQIIKYFITALRPYPYFQTMGITLPSIDGETARASSASFPSGHTATAFSVLSSLVLMFPRLKKYWGWLLLLTLLIAYSRMYLSNHFLMDLTGGATLGMLATILSYAIVARYINRRAQAKGYRDA